jgi:hypothetical protein
MGPNSLGIETIAMTKVEEFAALSSVSDVYRWVNHHRDLLSRALRRDASLENPSNELAEEVGIMALRCYTNTKHPRTIGRILLHAVKDKMP